MPGLAVTAVGFVLMVQRVVFAVGGGLSRLLREGK